MKKNTKEKISYEQLETAFIELLKITSSLLKKNDILINLINSIIRLIDEPLQKIDIKGMKLNELAYAVHVLQKFGYLEKKYWKRVSDKFTMDGKDITRKQLAQAKKGMSADKLLTSPPKRRDLIDKAVEISLMQEKIINVIIKKNPKIDSHVLKDKVSKYILKNYDDIKANPKKTKLLINKK